MKTTTLPCPNCSKSIEIAVAQWCHCVTLNLSVVCSSCGTCFCKLLNDPQQAEWKIALRELVEEETEEKFRRAISASLAGDLQSRTVLVVDDDEEIRLIAEYTLQQMGYRTLSAANANEAFAIVETEKPDVVLTDALMPKVDGRQLCRLIKADLPETKVVVMSGLYTNSKYRLEALNSFQADEYLAKPINFQRLHQVLEGLFAKAA